MITFVDKIQNNHCESFKINDEVILSESGKSVYNHILSLYNLTIDSVFKIKEIALKGSETDINCLVFVSNNNVSHSLMFNVDFIENLKRRK